MKILPTKPIRYKDRCALAVFLDETDNPEALDKSKAVVVLARRDLVFLQRFFTDFEKGHRTPDHRAFRRKIIALLDSLTQVS